MITATAKEFALAESVPHTLYQVAADSARYDDQSAVRWVARPVRTAVRVFLEIAAGSLPMTLAGRLRSNAPFVQVLSSGQSRGLQADAHTGNGYKWSLRTLHLADREVDKSLTKGFVGNSRGRQKSE